MEFIKGLNKQAFKRNAYSLCTAVGLAGVISFVIGMVFVSIGEWLYAAWACVVLGIALVVSFVFADRILGFDPQPHVFENNDPGDVGRRYSF